MQKLKEVQYDKVIILHSLSDSDGVEMEGLEHIESIDEYYLFASNH